MADENRPIDPLLLRAIRGPLSRNPSTTRGAGLDPSIMRTLMLNQPGLVGWGTSKGPGFNPSQAPYKPTAPSIDSILSRYPKPPGMGPQPDVNIPTTEVMDKIVRRNSPNPSISQYTKFLKEQGIPYEVRLSPKFKTAYIHYGPEKDKKIFTLRVPHPDKPHVGKLREGEDPKAFIDTAGIERIGPDRIDPGPLRNSAGGSFSDINNVKDAIKWQLGQMTPVGSEPYVHSPDYSPLRTKGTDHLKSKSPPQKHFMDKMLHKDEPQGKMPPIMGGDPSNALHSSQLEQRFNLVTPKDLGNFGSKQYDPMADPSYLQLMALVKRYAKPPGNDR